MFEARLGVTRMINLLAIATALVASGTAAAATATLESANLRVDVTAAPYSYSVIEKATGTVLLTQSQRNFRWAPRAP